TNAIASASDDWILQYDMYAGMFNLNFSGESWAFGSQSFPAQQANGGTCWGQLAFPPFIVFNPEAQCFTDFEGFRDNGTPFLTSKPGGIPDSLRSWMAHQQQCFRFAVSLACNSNEGGYWDNITLAFVDGVSTGPGPATFSVGAVSADIWQPFNDTFPANETAGLPGSPAFDTTSALIKTGINNAQATGDALRFDIPGDSSCAVAGNATLSTADDPSLAAVRVDLVFRILPGPGNYKISAGRNFDPNTNVVTGVLLQSPTNQAANAVAG